jgi:N-acetylneuraminic acid mutarotase
VLPSLPGPVQEHAVVALDGKVVVMGGVGERGQAMSRVVAFDPKTSTWTALAPLPKPTHHVNAAVVGTTLYVLGGLYPFQVSRATLAYDLQADAWTARAPMPKGTERGASFVGAIDGVVYLAGGYRGSGAFADCSAYDTVKDEWSTCTPLPAPLDHGMSVVIAGKLYAFGGRNGAQTALVDRVNVYDPKARTWTPRAPMPRGRAGGVASIVNGLVVITGGEGNASSPTGMFDATDAYDPAADRWFPLTPMRTPRHGAGAATVGGLVYVPGGATLPGLGASAVFEALVF